MGSKLTPRWLGPYRVLENLQKGRVRFQNINTSKILKSVYHVANLKVYKRPGEEVSKTDNFDNISDDNHSVDKKQPQSEH